MGNRDEEKDRGAVKAVEKGAAYVNAKPRTRQQVIRYLREKGFAEDDIAEAVEELEEYHYIDDFKYSMMYFEYGFEKGRGVGRIRRELAEKGVAADIIDMAYDELEEVPDQFRAAMEIGESMTAGIDVQALDHDGKRKLQGRIGRRLMSRGFTSETAYKVINRLM